MTFEPKTGPRRTESGVRSKLDTVADCPAAMRAQMDTVALCPANGCEGGSVMVRRDDGARYSFVPETCSVCEGAGVVPVWQADEYRIRNAASGHR